MRCISTCEAFQRNTELQSKAISPPVVLDLARRFHSALGENAAKTGSQRCSIDQGRAGFIPLKMQVVTARSPCDVD
jgi:hypothetical protein